VQQHRLIEIKRDLVQRIAIFKDSEALFRAQGLAPVAAQLGLSRQVNARILSTLAQMSDEEERLLGGRELREAERAQQARIAFVVLVLLVGAGLMFLYRRIGGELRQRERAQAEAQRLSAIIEATPDLVAIADENRRYVYFNRAARRVLGLTADDLDGGLSMETLHPAWAMERLNSQGLPAARAAGTWHGETAFIARDGEEIPISKMLMAHRQSDGSLLYSTIARDMREAKAAEAALKASEARLQQILDLLPTGVFVADAHGALTYINPEAKTIWAGSRAAQGVAQYGEYIAWRLDTGKRVAADEWGLARALATGETSRDEEFEIQCFDGSRKIIRNTCTPLRAADGRIDGGIAVNLDISDLKQKERRLRQASRYDETLARITELLNRESDRAKVLEGTLLLLAEQHFYPISAFYAFDELSGLLRVESSRALGAELRPLQRLGEGLAGQAARDRKSLVTDLLQAERGFTLDAALGQLGPAALLHCPVLYGERLFGVLALGSAQPLSREDREFTELIAAQLAIALHNLKQLEDTRLLAEQLRVRGEEIQQKNLQLIEADRMKSEFLANMSHELRTPLNAIIGFSELMRDGLVGDINDEQKTYLDDVLASGKHLLEVINDILDLSKVESGRMTLELEPFDVAALAASGIATLKEKALAHRLRLEQDLAADLGGLLLDPRKTKQIVYNLLSNAVKFTPDGGKVLLSLRRASRVEIEALLPHPGMRMFPVRDREAKLFLEIAVEDTGIGIAHESLQHLFEAFTQIDSTLARRYEGTGLGLVMVRKLAELQGGGVMVSSSPGKGSRFVVWLPWRTEAPAPTLAAPEAAAAKAKASDQRLVLLVEDDLKSAEITRRYLEAGGYRVVHAGDGAAGLRLAGELHPAAIVLDILLPGTDGWEVLSRLKSNAATAHIPVVILSIVDDARRGFALGASQVLLKPVSQAEFADSMAALGFAEGHGERVLVVDDDPSVVNLLCADLRAGGFSPVAAYGGREALSRIAAEPPRAVVLDLMMPDVSGFDVVEAMRASPASARIPIIVVTAKTLDAAERERLNGQVYAVVEKTAFDASGLLAELRRALARATNGKVA